MNLEFNIKKKEQTLWYSPKIEQPRYLTKLSQKKIIIADDFIFVKIIIISIELSI